MAPIITKKLGATYIDNDRNALHPHRGEAEIIYQSQNTEGQE